MTNVGSVDRALRILFGILLVIAVFIPQIGGLLVGWGSWKYVVTAGGGSFSWRQAPCGFVLPIRS